MKITDCRVLLLLEMLDGSEPEYDEILSGDDNFFFYSVASCYMQRILHRACEYFESAIENTVFSRRMQESFSSDKRNLRALYSEGYANRKNR